MNNVQTATCQDCGWTGPVDDTLEFRHLHERVYPGDVMPAGDCPVEGCGGAAMLDRLEPATGPRLQPVCNTCGGTGVRVDAWASWDIDAQRWGAAQHIRTRRDLRRLRRRVQLLDETRHRRGVMGRRVSLSGLPDLAARSCRLQ